MNIKDIEKHAAHIDYVRAGVVYYEIRINRDEHPNGVPYRFPVPLEDVGNATLSWEEKGFTLMRFIRKALEDGTFVRVHA